VGIYFDIREPLEITVISEKIQGIRVRYLSAEQFSAYEE
jgi:hypothetical protein